MSSRKPTRLWVLLVVLALVGAGLAMRSERAGAWACRKLREGLPGLLNAEVALGRCSLDPLSGSLRVSEVRLQGRSLGGPVVEAEEATVALRGVFLGGIDLQQVVVVRPKVFMQIEAPVSAVDGGSATGCALDELGRLRIRGLDVEGGLFDITLPDGRRVVLEGVDVTASLTRSKADLEVRLRQGQLRLAADRVVPLGRSQLQAALDVDRRSLAIDRLDIEAGGIAAGVAGSIESLCDRLPTVAVSGQLFAPMQAVGRLMPGLPPPSGQVLARVSVGGPVNRPNVRAEVQATKVRLGPFFPGDLTANVSVNAETVVIDEVVTRIGEGVATVSGRIELKPGLPVSVKVSTKDASLGQALERSSIKGPWVDFAASVEATLTGTLSPLKLGGDAEFVANGFALTARPFDAPRSQGLDILRFERGGGRFHLNVMSDSIAFEEATVWAGRSKAGAYVKLNFDLDRKGLEVRARAEQLDLNDFSSIAELPFAGSGSASVTVLGPPADIVVDGVVSLRDFKIDGYSMGVVQSPVRYVSDTLSFPSVVAQKGKTQYFGEVTLAFLEELQTKYLLQMPDGRVEDVLEILRELSPSMENVIGDLTGKVRAVGVIDSPASAATGTFAVQLQDARYQGRRLGAADVELRFEEGRRLVLQPTLFEGPLGRTQARGAWAFAGPLDFTLDVEDGAVGELLDPAGASGWPVRGGFGAHVVIGGTSDEVRVDGRLSGDSRYQGRDVGPFNLKVGVVGREVTFEGPLGRGVDSTGALTLKGDVPTTAHLDVDVPDVLAFFSDRAQGIEARAVGAIDLTGPWRRPELLAADVRLRSLALARGELTASNVEPISLRWSAGALELQPVTLRGPTMEVSAVGSWGPVVANLSTSGRVDLRLLSGVLGELERPQGLVDFTASFTGSIEKPQIAGSADLRDLRGTVKGRDINLKSFSGHADFSGSRVLLQDVQGFVNSGRVRGRGDARLDRFSITGYEFSFELEDVPLALVPDAPATLSGALVLAKRNEVTQLSGAVEVSKLRYTQSLSLEDVLNRARVSVSVDERAREWLKFDVDVTAGDDVRLENDIALPLLKLGVRARMAGKLKVGGSNVSPTLVGTLETRPGAQAYFRGINFAVDRGVFQFSGLIPTLDVSAQAQLREFSVRFKAFGALDDPKWSLSSEPGLAEADLLSLVTLGVTTRERLREASGVGLVAETLLAASGLDQQVQRFLTGMSDKIGLNQQVRVTSTFNEATGTTEPSVAWEGRIDKFRVSASQSITGQRGSRIQGEYRFNPRVSARGQWDNQTQITTFGNFGLEAQVRFEWE